MKHLSILFLALGSIHSMAYSQWSNQGAPPSNATYTSVSMQNGMVGWLSGQYAVSRTTNGGDSWSSIPIADSTHQVKKIKFLNDSIGFALGYSRTRNFNYIRKTFNGGATWKDDTSLFALCSANGISFLDISFTACPDYQLIWLHASTFKSSSGFPRRIYCSKDSGKTWNEFTALPDTNLTISKVLFLDSTRGFIMVSQTLYRTSNAGQTWEQYTLNVGNGHFSGIQFFNSDTGIFVGQGNVSPSSFWAGKTYDGGKTWSVDSSTIGFFSFAPFRILCFTDVNHGFSVNPSSKAVIRTTNGGSTWTQCMTESPSSLLDVHSVDGKTVIATGGRSILVSHDSGVTFTDMTPPSVIHFSYVRYLSANLVIAMGNNYNFFLSDDSGKSWVNYKLPTGRAVRGITFLDTVQGWIVDDSSRIYHTTNTGKTWSVQKEYNYLDPASRLDPPLRAIHFFNNSVGCAVGEFGFITATVNGGVQWKSKVSTVTDTLRGVFVASPNKAWVVGARGTILVSSDSCTSWRRQTSPVSTTLQSATFTDTLHGYILADSGVVLKTTNGGELWEKIESPHLPLNAVRFINQDKGWLVGSGGKIFRTLNGGAEWEAQPSGVDVELTGIDFISTTQGIIVGSNGVVLTTHNAGGATLVENKFSDPPVSFTLAQNYPNPFNPSTTITISIPTTSFVSLKIYDLVGREVATLISNNLWPGRYEYTWNAEHMPSGVYFYRLQVGSFTETKKLMFLK